MVTRLVDEAFGKPVHPTPAPTGPGAHADPDAALPDATVEAAAGDVEPATDPDATQFLETPDRA